MHIFKATLKKKKHFKTTSNVNRKTLSSLSSSKEICEETLPYYEKYLSNCRYRENLNYRDPASSNLITKRKEGRKILWFNPPYSKTVKKKNWFVLFVANQKAFSKRA